MNAKLLLTMLCSFCCVFAQAQYTAGDRYQKTVFSAYDSVMNVKYGANATASSSTPQDLLMDIYMPKGDTLMKRPVVFFTHGGSFISGSKESMESVFFCKEFAKRGYVTVSQNYRLGFDSYDETGALRTVWRAAQDGRAAVRYMRANAALYGIDTNMIIYGGTSAGAILSLQLAFLDQSSEVPAKIDTSAYTPNGTGIDGLEGMTNNLKNSSKVQAVINLCGAIGDTSWITSGDASIPVLSMHGTADDVVPYGTATIKIFGIIPLLDVSGSGSIRERLNHLGFHNRMYTYCGAGHVPFGDGTTEGMRALDSTFKLINQFLYEDVLKCGIAEVRVNDIDSSQCAALTGITTTRVSNDLVLYPNPAGEHLFIRSHALPAGTPVQVEIMDMMGRKVLSQKHTLQEQAIDISHLPKGSYSIRLKANAYSQVKNFIRQ